MAEPSEPLPRVFLLPGRDKRLRGGHPWVYSNEVRMDAAAKALPAGSLVTLHRVDGKPFGVGSFNPGCLIAFRLFTAEAHEAVDAAFVARRLERALTLRERLFDAPYYRLVHGEADGLPGLVVDRFGDALCVQTASAGAEALLPAILAALDAVLAPACVMLRNDGPFRRLEGLEEYSRLAKGRLDGPGEVREGGLMFYADLAAGQKTGWYFDQRPNRAFAAALVGPGDRMLDVYCHSGAFAVAAAAAGAGEALGIDSSEPALALARRAAAANRVGERCAFRRGDAFEEMERLAAAGERFQLVAADPPAFVRSRRELKSGLKG